MAAHDLPWGTHITHVAIDLSAAYAAARLGLPHAIMIADRFHLVRKPNGVVGAVRRRLTRTQRGRCGRKVDVEWINRRRPLRAAERLTPDQHAELLSADLNEDIAAAWIAKELLRELLSRADQGGLHYQIHAALDRFCRICAAGSVPEVISVALPSRTGRPRSSPPYRPDWPAPAPRSATPSSNTSGASPSASATPTTSAAAYGGPAPDNHGESHTAGTNATANCEEPDLFASSHCACCPPESLAGPRSVWPAPPSPPRIVGASSHPGQ